MGFFCTNWSRHLSVLSLVASAFFSANASRVSQTHMPLVFEPNQGQAPPGADYIVHNGMSEALLSKDGIRLVLPRSGNGALDLDIELIGSNPDSEIVGLSPLKGHSNYLTGKDPSGWVRGVPKAVRNILAVPH